MRGQGLNDLPRCELEPRSSHHKGIFFEVPYDNSENKIGEVTDLVLDNEGNVMTAVIGVGGVLGGGHKHVAVPFKELKISSRDGKEWLVLNRTKDDLKNAPAFDKKSQTNKM